MPPDGHTRKQPTTPTLTTSLTREICRTCADRARRSRPPSACHRHRMDTLHRSSDFKATKQPTEEHLGHAGKIRLPKPEPRPKLLSTPSSLPNRNQRPEMAASANYTAKMPQPTRQRCRHPLVSRLWPAPRLCPQGGRRREGVFIARSRRSEVSLRSQGRGKGGGAPHNNNASKKEHDAHGRRRRQIRQRPDIGFLPEMLNHHLPAPSQPTNPILPRPTSNWSWDPETHHAQMRAPPPSRSRFHQIRGRRPGSHHHAGLANWPAP